MEFQTRFLVREEALKAERRNCQMKEAEQDKIWSRVPKGGPIPRRTGRLTVGRKKNSNCIPLFKCIGCLDTSQNSLQATTSHVWSNTQTNLDLRNTSLGYGFHFQHRYPRTLIIGLCILLRVYSTYFGWYPRTFPIESFTHDIGRK
jgi:hypothetical protein